VDFIAYSNWSGLAYLKAHHINNVILLNPPLARPSFYTYLHKKHKNLVPKLAAVLKKMKSDGTLQAMFDQRLRPYLPASQKQQYKILGK